MGLIRENGQGSTRDIMRQTSRAKAMHMGDSIQLNLMCSATVVGRTFEEEPRLDLRTPWGTLNGIPQSVLGDMGLAVPSTTRSVVHPMPDNVEKIRLAPRAGGGASPRLPIPMKR